MLLSPKKIAHPVPGTGQEVDVLATTKELAKALTQISMLDRKACRTDFEERFTITRMATEHLAAYQKLVAKQ